MAIKDLLPTARTTPTGPRTKGVDNKISGQTQQQPQTEGEQISMLGKALSSFGKALETPGFRQMLGQIGTAIGGQGSTAERLGTASAQINQQMIDEQRQQQQARVLETVMQGGTPSFEDLQNLDPQTQNQILGTVLQRQQSESRLAIDEARLGLQQLQGEAYRKQVERMETPEERARREQSNIALQAYLSDRSDPTPWQPYKGEDGLYMANTATGEMVKKVDFPTAPEGGLTPSQAQQMHEDYLKLAIDLAEKDQRVQAYGEMVTGPNGKPMFKWLDEEGALQMRNQVATEFLNKFEARNLVPESYTTLFGDIDNSQSVDVNTLIQQIKDEYHSGPLTTKRYDAAEDSVKAVQRKHGIINAPSQK
jgi:hypothetical protein